MELRVDEREIVQWFYELNNDTTYVSIGCVANEYIFEKKMLHTMSEEIRNFM